MRRVVPISRTSRGASSLVKRPEKPPGQQRGSSSTATPTASNLSSTSVRRGEKPSTAPSSRRSSINKAPDPKDSKDQRVPGTQASAREKNQDLQRKPSVRKPLTKPKPPPEEKMCRSTLRALSQGGGGSVSAPVTPLHKAATPSSSPLPGFARSTASSSFRRTRTTLAPPAPSPHTGSDSSPKSSPKTTSSFAMPFTRTGSLRVPATSRSSDLLNPSSSSSSSSPLRSQSIRASTRSPVHNSPAPPKGHRRTNSGNFSDKSTHSRDSGKSTRPSWR